MGTTIRPEVSERSKYYINRHRYYELKHFCLQYPIWKKAYLALDGLNGRPFDLASAGKASGVGDPTGKCVEARSFFFERMEMIERVARATDDGLSSYILEAVTGDVSYEQLRSKWNIPCCKDTYYTLYRRFFWLLNRERD